MPTIITRAAKGSELTHAEMDQNLTNLNEGIETGRADAVLKLQAMTEAEFMARAAVNRDRYVSGFIKWGSLTPTGLAAFEEINRGLYVRNHSSLSSSYANQIYLQKMAEPSVEFAESGGVVNIHGFTVDLGVLSGHKNSVGYHGILLPPAPATADTLERDDFVLLRMRHETIGDKDFVYANGNSQSLVTVDPATGLATASGSFSGYETYSLFGSWQSPGDLVGRGLVWSTMSDSNKKKFISEPKNNVYLSKDSEFKQVINSIQVIPLSGSGHTVETAMAEAGYTQDAVDKGLWVSGDYYAVPICLVPRLNKGAHHWLLNTHGAGCFVDGGSIDFWYEPFTATNAYTPTSIEDCFLFDVDTDGLWVTGGYIGYTYQAQGGRPDGKYYDAIYESDVIDFRNSAHKVTDSARCRDREFQYLVDGEIRGWEGSPRLNKYLNPKPSGENAFYVFDNGDQLVIYEGVATQSKWCNRFAPVGDSIAIYIPSSGWNVYQNQGDYAGGAEIKWKKIHGTYTPNNGAVVAEDGYFILFDPSIGTSADYDPSGYSFWSKPTKSKTLLQCDIIGSPANYPTEWLTNGIAGTSLLAGEDGESLIPDGTSKTINFSRKVKTHLLSILSDDNGVTWAYSGVIPEATTNACTTSYAAGKIWMIFYLTESSPFETANNAEVLSLGNVWAGNFNQTKFISDLIGKVAVGTSNPVELRTPLKTWAMNGDKLSTVASGAPTHELLSLPATNPAAKVLYYLTSENGRAYLQLLFKEMVYDTSWGDDGKFNVVDGSSTTTDDNGNTVLIGQKRIELPYFMGDSE